MKKINIIIIGLAVDDFAMYLDGPAGVRRLAGEGIRHPLGIGGVHRGELVPAVGLCAGQFQETGHFWLGLFYFLKRMFYPLYRRQYHISVRSLSKNPL